MTTEISYYKKYKLFLNLCTLYIIYTRSSYNVSYSIKLLAYSSAVNIIVFYNVIR